MSDKLTIEQRHYNMSRIRGKDTKPEIIVRKFLWSNGFRYRLNHPRLPGKPDIVLRKYRTCIFINGCFWHGHGVTFSGEIRNSVCCKIPKSNQDFWMRKIARNQERDVEVMRKLASMGWHSLSIWECELKPAHRQATLDSLLYTLNGIFLQDHRVKRYEIGEDEYSMIAAEDVE